MGEATKHLLQVRLFMCHKCTVISEEGFLDEVNKGLCFGKEATKIKQGAIQTISDVHPIKTLDYTGVVEQPVPAY